MRNEAPSALPVAVIGAGPTGLAAAAHLAERNIPFEVFEAGHTVGQNLAAYAHVRLFSPWRFNVDRAGVRLLAGNGWSAPDPDKLPSAGELVDRYLAPLGRSPYLAPHIRLAARVVAVSKTNHDKVKSTGRDAAPFVLQVQENGRVTEYFARAVLDATGTWNQPNPIGAHGLPALGEREHAERIAYGMPDILGAARSRYARRTVLVVGAGHSAAGNLLSLAALAADVAHTHIVWALRGNDLRRLFGGGANDGLPARGALGRQLQQLVANGGLEIRYGFRIHHIRKQGAQLQVLADDPHLASIDMIDEVIAATGSRPDLSLTRELRVRNDDLLESTAALAPLIDPNVHSCGTVRPHGHRELEHPERGYYAIGAKSYGRAPNFLMATGYEQARSVVAALAGDFAAADDVQLELPATGVCSTDFIVGTDAAVADACCGGPAKAPATACCALDETKKAAGEIGCGCPTA
ncbi:MAG TPA: FAD-dependent oxidoreductase [Burkholderiales bacterium]|nr:FAD-dependent oxidoreductase [Burkholderiales bacterium]